MQMILPLMFTIFISGNIMATELYVIVNKNNNVNSLEISDLKKIYLGKKKRFESGKKIKVIDYKGNDEVKKVFYQLVARRSVRDVKNYWYKLVFTGKAVPPVPLKSAKEVVEYVENNESAIGYVPKEAINDKVKSILKLQP